MRKSLLFWMGGVTLVAIVTCGVFLTQSNQINPVNTTKIEREADSDDKRKSRKMKEEEEEEDKRSRIDKAMELEFEKTKDPALNEVPRRRLMQAYRIAEQRRKEMATRGPIGGSSSAIVWEERGPSNVAGRTRALMYDLSDAPNYRKVWAGGVGGGLWYTNDITVGTPTWVEVDPFLENLAISTIAQDPTNTSVIYAGTGEGWFNSDAIRGLGIWKSSDGGANWSQLPSTDNDEFDYVNKLVVTGNGTVLAGNRSRYCNAGGLWRSTNGGTSWSLVLTGDSGTYCSGNSRWVTDIEVASNGDIYAALGMNYSDGIYRSTDDGLTWTKVYTSAANEERIELACAPSASGTVYALIENTDSGGVPPIKKTTNSGGSWSNMSTPTWYDTSCASASADWTRSQDWYDLIASVDPTNANVVYIGGVDLFKSTNGGSSWTQISSWWGGCDVYVHADQHAMTFKPGSSELLFGNDGGVYRTTTGGTSFESKNNGYNVTQFYACAMSGEAGKDAFLAGAQDNGTQYYTNAGMNATTEVTGGDGAFCHIDQDNDDIQISSYVYNAYRITNNGWGSYNSYSIGSSTGRFINPTDYDSDANVLYGAHNGGVYSYVTGVGTSNTTGTRTMAGFGGSKITTVHVDVNTANRVWFGFSGKIIRVDNANSGAASATDRTPGNAGWSASGYVSSIEVQDGDANHILATVSNFGVSSVWETTNGGTSWTEVEGDLPDIPVRGAIFNPNNSDQALLATEMGVWTTDNLNGTSTAWAPSNNGLANVRTDMLQWRSSDNTVIAATHGRGLFSTNFFRELKVAFNSENSQEAEFHSETATTGCNEYRTVMIPVSTSRAISDGTSIPVTVSVNGISTATSGRDFQLVTTSLTFDNSKPFTQNIELRIYDDPIEESVDETIVLDIDAGATYNGATIRHTVSVKDNDLHPITGEGSSTLTVGTQTGSATAYPLGGYYEDQRAQMIYPASMLTGAGLIAGNLTALDINVLVRSSTIPYSNFTIKLKNTTTTDFSGVGGAYEAGATTVYTGTFDPSVGWNTITFDTPFTWDGTSNLLVETCFNNTAWTADDEVAVISGGGGYSAHLDRIDGTIGCNITSVNVVATNLPHIRLTQDVNIPIENANDGSSLMQAYIDGNETGHFYSDDGEIMLSIENLDAAAIGCVSVSVDGSGAGRTAMTNTTGSFHTNKTYMVTADNDRNYRITLYYDAAELSVWGAAPLFMMKSSTSIASTNDTNYEALAAGLSRTDYNSGNKTAFSGTFSSFSGFAMTDSSEPFPVELLDFKGRLVDDSYVRLDWTTVAEVNNEGFDVERSTDGSRFEKIGFVKGQGNTVGETNYKFNDEDLAANVLYYRLKQKDLDGTFEYTNVVTVRIPGRGTVIENISPNPFSNTLNIQFGSEVEGDVEIRIFDLSGKLLMEQRHEMGGSETLTLNQEVSGLPSGTYIIEASYQEFTERHKLVKR